MGPWAPTSGHRPQTPDTAGEGASQVCVEGGAHPGAHAGHGAAVVQHLVPGLPALLVSVEPGALSG